MTENENQDQNSPPPAKKSSRRTKAEMRAAQAKADRIAGKLRARAARLNATAARKTASVFARATGGKVESQRVREKGRKAFGVAAFPRPEGMDSKTYGTIMRRIGRVFRAGAPRNWQEWWQNPMTVKNDAGEQVRVESIRTLVYDSLGVSRCPKGCPFALEYIKRAFGLAQVRHKVRNETRPTDVGGGNPEKGKRNGDTPGRAERSYNVPFVQRIRARCREVATKMVEIAEPSFRCRVAVNMSNDEEDGSRITEPLVRRTKSTYSWRRSDWYVCLPDRWYMNVFCRNLTMVDGKLIVDAEAIPGASAETFRVKYVHEYITVGLDSDKNIVDEFAYSLRVGTVTRCPISGRYKLDTTGADNNLQEAADMAAALDNLGIL